MSLKRRLSKLLQRVISTKLGRALMSYGFAAEIAKYMKLLSEDNRYRDVGFRFNESNFVNGILVRTGTRSQVFGGLYDVWTQKYIGECNNPIEIDVSPKQLNLILDETNRIEVNGGRGSAKSYGGCLWVIKQLFCDTGRIGQIAGSEHKVVKQDWNKLLGIIPADYFLPGSAGIRVADKEMHFVNGSMLRFVSCQNIGSLRSWGGHFCLVDEEQDVKDEALDVIWPSLRLAREPTMMTCGTPMRGEYEQRHKRNLEGQANGDEFSCHRFESYDNIFVPKKTFDLAKKQMDKMTYQREILADWNALDDGEPIVFRCFSRDLHGIATTKGLKDITLSYTKKKCRMPRAYIVGVDPNWDYPNYAVVYKVFHPNIWVAIDVVSCLRHCGELGKVLVEKGYSSSVIISDASGRYNRGLNSSDRMLRAKGFFVTHPHVNPRQTESIDALLLKMDPMEGRATWRILLPNCDELAEAMEVQIWNKQGQKLDKSRGTDHVIDAARYPVSFFEPAARMKRITFRGNNGNSKT